MKFYLLSLFLNPAERWYFNVGLFVSFRHGFMDRLLLSFTTLPSNYLVFGRTWDHWKPLFLTETFLNFSFQSQCENEVHKSAVIKYNKKMLPIYKNKDLYAGQALQNTLFNLIGMTQRSWNTSKTSTGGHELSRESNKRKGRNLCSRRKFGRSWRGGWFSEHWLAEGQH